jgi:hypothetical protein
MPVKPENRHRYPANWKELVELCKQRTIADNGRDCCEGSPLFPDCRAENYQPHPDTGGRVVLTTAHVNHVVEDCSPDNLRRWCNRCHLSHDAQHHAQTAYATRKARANTNDLFGEKNP